MKILHTSDWHLGHTLYNYDRTQAQMAMLQQMRDIVAKEQPDVFLLSGDVYHTAQPSSAVQTMFTNAVVELHKANPDMTIVVTAGNHDSGAKHEIYSTAWRALNVYSVGNISREEDDLDELIIEVKGRGYVIAMPYVYERNLPEGIFQKLLDKVAERNTENLPVVIMAHTTVLGCDFAGHDNASDKAVGGIDSCSIETFGEGYDYVALGHIHHAQFIHGTNHRIRYSGTPLAIRFDEAFEHSVSMVEIEQHGAEPKVETIEIDNPIPLVTLPASGAADWETALKLLQDFPDDTPAYIRLNVEVEDFLSPEANNDAQQATKGKKCLFCLINYHRKEHESAMDERIFTVEEFQAEDPIDIARNYAKFKGIDFDDDFVELFKEAAQSVSNDERQ
jgi:exonuclease SbcD